MSASRQRQPARCVKCGHVATLGAFEVEVALSADDAGDNDWVINFACPACEGADRPELLTPESSAGPRPLSGPRGNPMYDPNMP